MRKILSVVVLTVVFIAGACVPSFAAKAHNKKKEVKKYDRIVAQVTSIDAAAKTIVVTREENGESRTIKVSEKAISQLQVGDRIRIKLKAGTNESAGVRVLGAKPVAEEAAPATDAAPEVEKQ